MIRRVLALIILFCLSSPALAAESLALGDGKFVERFQERLSDYKFWKGLSFVNAEGSEPENKAERWLVIDKGVHRMALLEKHGGELAMIRLYIVATGRNSGQKKKSGDLKTPEGIFSISSIEDASGWAPYVDQITGERTGYGPFFLRLATPPWKGIGIHGTDEGHYNELGTDASHGCIRMDNEELRELKKLVKKGTTVIIYP